MSNPDWWLDPPDESEDVSCDICRDIFRIEYNIHYYEKYRKFICDDCIDEYEEQRRFCPECGYVWVDCQCGL